MILRILLALCVFFIAGVLASGFWDSEMAGWVAGTLAGGLTFLLSLGTLR